MSAFFLYSDFEIVQERAVADFALLLQALDEDSWAHVEYAGKMLDATALIKATAADEFAFFGFGEEHVLGEFFGFDFLDALGGGGVGLRRNWHRMIAELQTRSA